MTIRELSELLGVSEITVRRAIQKQFPDLIKHGIETRLTFEQSKRVIGSLKVSSSARITAVEQNTDVLRQNVGLDNASITSMLRAAADAIENRDKQIAVLTPKAEVYEAIASANGLYSMLEASKLLNYGRNRLFEVLRSAGVLMANNTPYQTYCERGYFKVKSLTRNDILLHQTFVTGKGILWMQRELTVIESRVQIGEKYE